MTDDILDIEKWKNEYPFLKEVSDVYDEYNNNEYVGTYEGLYYSLCNIIIGKVKGDVGKNSDICKKLMRNLGHLSENPKDYELTTYRCNILFHWLYTFLDKDKITYEIIDKCFDTYYDDSPIKGNTMKKCHHYVDKNNEPIKITLLNIFNDNMHIIQKTLSTDNEQNKTLCQKFVCKCLKIYKHMKKTYCFNAHEQSQNPTYTCLKLSHFERSYKLLHDSIVSIYPKIPSLDNIDSKCLDKHASSEQEDSLGLRDQGNRSRRSGDFLTEAAGDPGRALEESLPAPLENGDSSIKKSITTTIGTVAGASSLLALLYKFSPGGNWIRSGFREGRGRINSNLYAEGPNELLFDGLEHGNLNSYNIGYEAAYDRQ
ncbi:Plasmodium vivax Vir protein, putative [Plasmodium vivax]|nr:Plasmodium vivax Vir protein, putative [Plasmodium vivax]